MQAIALLQALGELWYALKTEWKVLMPIPYPKY